MYDNQNKLTRKAQVSIFIIIGLVALLGVIVTTAIFTDFLEYKPPEQQVSSELETELRPFVSAVEQCQQSITESHTREILQSGGYLNPQESGIIALPQSTGTGVNVGSNQPVAYWRYIDESVEQTKRPPLESNDPLAISTQLEQVLDAEIEECVPWEEFTQYQFERTQPFSQISFDLETMTISTNWAVSVDTALGQREYDQFVTELHVPAGRLYNLAYDVTSLLEQSDLLENRLMDWLYIYAGVTDIPPLDGSMRVDSSLEIYDLQEAKSDVRNVITRSLNYIQLYGSDNATLRLGDVEALNQIQINSLIPETPYTSPNVHFSAFIPRTADPYFAVNGNTAVALPEITSLGPLTMFGLGMIVDDSYFFDIRYPAVLQFEQDGYSMNVAYQATIVQNYPQETQPDQSQSEDVDMCANPGGATVRVSTNQPQLSPQAIYTCGSYTCPVGEVVDGELETQLPTCASGELELLSPGYFSEVQQVQSAAGSDPISLEVDFYQPTNVTIDIVGRSVRMNQSEDFYLGDNVIPTTADIFFIRQGQAYFSDVQDRQATLVPGVYDVFAINMREYPESDPFIIEEDTREEGGVLGIGEQEFTLDEVRLTEIPVGYADFSDERAVTIGSGTTNIQLTIATLNPDIMQKHEHLEAMGALFEFGNNLDPQTSVITS